jgi:hypothetical protein
MLAVTVAIVISLVWVSSSRRRVERELIAAPPDHATLRMVSHETSDIIRFIGVYNAEGTLRGELAYWLGRRRGTAHCALCDITHGSVRERADWRQCRAQLPVAFETYHLEDQPSDVREIVAGRAPAVLADTPGGPILLLGPDQLERCHASPDRLIEALRAAVDARGLAWPGLASS